MNYDKANSIIRRQKAALTRAKKLSPEAVLKACDAAALEWDNNPAFRNAQDVPVWPDNWHLWKRAKEDAEMAIRMNRPARY